MPENYIVLFRKKKKFGSLGTREGFETFGLRTDELKVVPKALEREQAATLAREDEDVMLVAPFMPMKLIAPVKKEVGVQLNSTVLWGIEAVNAHNSPFTGEGITVAVLDTGIDRDHDAFIGIDIVEEDFTGEGNGDSNGHGTHCAGTILGRDVNGVRIGIARGVKRLLVGKVLGANGGGSSETIVQAIEWAVKEGANVISMSLGIDFPGYVSALIDRGYPPQLATSLGLEGYRTNVELFASIVRYINSKGIGGFAQPVIIIAAAGNESRTDLDPKYKIAVSPPAVADGILSVGALGENGHGYVVAPFSNTGPILAAPGVGIISANAGGGLISMDGTSMATPHVAGVAALWAQKMGQQGFLNTADLFAKLRAFCDTSKLVGQTPQDFGAGLVQAPLI